MLSTEFRDEDEWKKKSEIESPTYQVRLSDMPRLQKDSFLNSKETLLVAIINSLARHGSELEMPFLKRFKMSGQGRLDVNDIYFLPD